MKKKSSILCAFFVLLTGCSSHHLQNIDSIDTSNLSQLERVQVPVRDRSTGGRDGLSGMRVRSIKDTSLSIGAQGGLAWSSQAMNIWLEKERKYLDSVFNFNALMLEHGVMPPVLETGDNNLNLSDPNTIRVADRTYKIIEQAHFATTPPNWREYLWLNYEKPVLPDKTLLPKTADEQKVWRDGIRAGWDKGIEQGYSIFQQNLARLKRDYNGMLLYRKLLQARMISAPFVARTELGVTGDGSDMRINDQVLRIVSHPQLQTNSKGWQASVVKNRQRHDCK
jgi:defect-in-organelle-trafficking protein DotC